MSDIENLHPLLGESEQHIQGRVTWSESELVIWEEKKSCNIKEKYFISTPMISKKKEVFLGEKDIVAVGEKEIFHINSNDESHDLADD